MPRPRAMTAALLTSPWPARVGWAALPLTVGPALGSALDGRSAAVQTVVATLAWATWTGVLVAVLVPRSTSLTVLRTGVPAVALAAAWAASRGDPAGIDIVAVAWSAALVLAAFAPGTGESFVNGSAYGDEHRMPLRIPASVAAGPVVLAWVAVVGPAVAGPLLLAARAWVAGALVLVLGAPLAYLGARALHGLARRWLVFVPAGVVVHDPMSIADPVLFPRTMVARIGPAPVGTDALDLTGSALGLALELELTEPATVVLRASGRRPRSPVEVTRLLVTPTRPGAVLRLATARHFAVG